MSSFTIPHGRPRVSLIPIPPIRRISYPHEATEGSLVAEARQAQLGAQAIATRSYEPVETWERRLHEADMIVARATPDGDFAPVAVALAAAHVARAKLPDLRRRHQSDREFADGHAESIRRRMDRYRPVVAVHDDGRVEGTEVALNADERAELAREIVSLVGPARPTDW